MTAVKPVARGLALIVAATGLAASCSAPERDCQPVSATYRRVFEDGSVTGTPFAGEVAFKPSGLRGAWYIVAAAGEATPVWVTDRDPVGDALGVIVDANRAAQRLSDYDFVRPPAMVSFSEIAHAAGSPDRIAAAERCFAG
jgi:PAS domain-containing protein